MTCAYTFKTITRGGLALLLVGCPDDKGGTTETTGATETSAATQPSTGGSTTDLSAGEETSRETEVNPSAASETSPTTGDPAGTCEEARSAAECAAAVAVGEAAQCVWLEVRAVEPMTCAFDPPQGQCFTVEVNDGGCATCLVRDIGGGRFEVAEDDVELGCSNVADFANCFFLEPEGDPEACKCICPDLQMP